MSVQKSISLRKEDDRFLSDHPEICLSRLVQSAIQQYRQRVEGGMRESQPSQH